jgi:hypothetical protein
VSLERKLVAGAVALLVAGGATGAGLAASGHSRAAAPARSVRIPSLTDAGFLRASAEYLGTDAATLRRETKSRTLAAVANATAGRSSQGLLTALVVAATSRVQDSTDRAFTRTQRHTIRTWLRGQLKGYLQGTCPLGRVSLLGLVLSRCHGMDATA